MKQNVIIWIQHNPLIAFFIVSIGIMYLLLFPVVFFFPKGYMLTDILGFLLGRISVYSPVFAGILIEGIIHRRKQKFSKIKYTPIFLTLWIVALVIHTLSLTYTTNTGAPLIGILLLSAPVALLPAWVITKSFIRYKLNNKWLETLIKPRGRIIYYLIALLTFPTVHILGTGISNLVSGDNFLPKIVNELELILTISVTFLSVLLFSGGINEESGWRGFAQKRLQRKYNPLMSAMILWVIMVLWHIPNDIIQYGSGGYLIIRIFLYPFITILFTWVYNRTNGSIIAPAIFHSSMNSMNPLMGLFPVNTMVNVLIVFFALSVVLIDRMWKKLPESHPAVYKRIT